MTYPRGIDISYCQSLVSIDWHWMLDNQVFVFVRAGQADFEDNLFQGHYNNGLAAGHRPALYWFMQPNMRHEGQVSRLLEIFNRQTVKPCVIALDCENISYYENASDSAALPLDHPLWSRYQPMPGISDAAGLINVEPPNKEYATFHTWQWLDKVAKATGALVILYSRKDYIDKWLLPTGTKFTYEGREYVAPVWSQWVDSWNATWTQYGSSPLIFRDWLTWTVWQYEGGTGRIDGVVGPCDQNYFNGTQTECNAYFEMEIGETEPMAQHNGLQIAWPQDLSLPNYDAVPIQWDKVIKHYLTPSFVYIAAGNGINPNLFSGENFKRQYDGAAGKILRSAYHIWSLAANPLDQAAWFFKMVAGAKLDIRPMVILQDDYQVEYAKRYADDSKRAKAWLVGIAQSILSYVLEVGRLFGQNPMVQMSEAWWGVMGRLLAVENNAVKLAFDEFYLACNQTAAGDPVLFELHPKMHLWTVSPTPPYEGFLTPGAPSLRWLGTDAEWGVFSNYATIPGTTPPPPATGDLATVLAKLAIIEVKLDDIQESLVAQETFWQWIQAKIKGLAA